MNLYLLNAEKTQSFFKEHKNRFRLNFLRIDFWISGFYAH